MTKYDLTDSTTIRYDFKRFAWFIALRTIMFLIVLVVACLVILFIGSMSTKIGAFKQETLGKFLVDAMIIIFFATIVLMLITIQHTKVKDPIITTTFIVLFIVIFSNITIRHLFDNSFISFNFDWFMQKLGWAFLASFVISAGTALFIFCFKVYKFNNAYNLINLIFNDCINKEYSKNEKFVIVPDELLHINFRNCDKNLAKYFIDEKESEKQSFLSSLKIKHKEK